MAAWLALSKVAVIVTGPAKAVLATLTAKLAEVAPAETLTEAGTSTSEEELEMVTTRPPDGAGPLSSSFPVEEPPGLTLSAFNFIGDNVGGLTVTVAV